MDNDLKELPPDYDAEPDLLDSGELEAKVCGLICKGKTAEQIVSILADEGITISREKPRNILQKAAGLGRVRYEAPISLTLSAKLKRDYSWLRTVRVVHSAGMEHITDEAAKTIVEMICDASKGKVRRKAFHLGFAGGGYLRQTAKRLSQRLWRTEGALPHELYFHSMVGPFDENPATDPNSFAAFFSAEGLSPIPTRFVNLLAPGIVTEATFLQLKGTPGIRESFERAHEIEVYVTSAGGHWGKGCSRLYEIYKGLGDPALLAELDAVQTIGDLMWRPLGVSGPVESPLSVRAFTLFNLSELPELIKRGKRVLLVMGPCVNCGKPKTALLSAVLQYSPPLITDLVVDSVTAKSIHNYEQPIGSKRTG